MTTADREIPGAQLEPLPTLPVFLKLAGKRVLLAGGDAPTVWKAELLVAAGARVDVAASRPCAEMLSQVGARSEGSIRLIARDWEDRDLAGAAIAIGSMADDAEAARFRDAARRAGVPVNVIDKPAFCDFQFGTVVARSPLVLAITTDGAAPVLGQALRTRLEALLPQNLRAWAKAAKAWRPRVEDYGWSFRRRRRFWEVFAQRALQPGAAAPDEAAFHACIEAAARQEDGRPTQLTLVGCGSGRPDDLTFSAARALQNADVVFYDPDVSVDTVALARRESRKAPAIATELWAEAAGAGRMLVWLGTGDPLSCPHWASRRAGLPADLSLVSLERGLQTCPRCDGRCLGCRP